MTLDTSPKSTQIPPLHVTLQARLGEEHRSCFLLADGARLGSQSARLALVSIAPALSLLTGGPVNDETSAGPLLYEIDFSKCSDKWIDDKLQSFLGNGSLSIVTSPLPAHELIAHLQAFIDIKLADGTTMVMRFFDPRVLPFWYDLLEEQHIAYLANGIDQWGYVNHMEGVAWLPLDSGVNGNTIFPMVLDEEQEKNLMDRCLPYALVDKVMDEDPEAMSGVASINRYSSTSFLIERARAHGFDGMGDFENFCRLGYAYGLDFDDRKPFADILKLKKFAHMHEVVAQLTAADWAYMEKSE